MSERKEYAVQELLDLALKYKALRIKTGPIEIELSPAAFGQEAAVDPLALDAPVSEFAKVPTLEEFTFMAGLQVEPAAGGAE